MLPKLLKTTEQYTADTGHLSGVDTGWAVGGGDGEMAQVEPSWWDSLRL